MPKNETIDKNKSIATITLNNEAKSFFPKETPDRKTWLQVDIYMVEVRV